MKSTPHKPLFWNYSTVDSHLSGLLDGLGVHSSEFSTQVRVTCYAEISWLSGLFPFLLT